MHGLGPVSQTRGSQTHYYLLDGHSGVRQLLTGAGAVAASYLYDAFGNLLASAGSVSNPLRYRGEWLDPTLGQYYLRARFYDPATGRFGAADPFLGTPTTPHSLHRYAYTGHDPVNFADPSGYYEGLGGLLVSMGIRSAFWATLIVTAIQPIMVLVGSLIMGGPPDAVAFGGFFAATAVAEGSVLTVGGGGIVGLEMLIEPRDKEVKAFLWGGAEFTGSPPPPAAAMRSLHDVAMSHGEIGVFAAWEWEVKGGPKPGPVSTFNLGGFALGDVFFGYEVDQFGNKALLTGATRDLWGHSVDLQVWGVPQGLQWNFHTWHNVSEAEMATMVGLLNTVHNAVFTYKALPPGMRNTGVLLGGAVVNGLLSALWVHMIYGRPK